MAYFAVLAFLASFHVLRSKSDKALFFALTLFLKHRKLGCFGSFLGWTLWGFGAVSVFLFEFHVAAKKRANSVYSWLSVLSF